MKVKKMKRKIVFALGIVSTLMITAILGFAGTEADPFVTDLIAGQHTDVGDVTVWNDGTYLNVTYVVNEPGWYLTETHLHVACDLEDIPQTKKNNPIPGRFDYKGEHDYITEYTYAIPLSEIECDDVFIAAHAVVEGPMEGCSAWDDLEDDLDGIIGTYIVSWPGIDSYFDVVFNGESYEGWCIDLSQLMTKEKELETTLISIFNPTLPTEIDKPENLSKVNYVLNKFNSGGYDSSVGWREIQAAIWYLMDDTDPLTVFGVTGITWNQAIADAVVTDALDNGDAFDYCEGNWLAFIAYTRGEQVILIKIPKPMGEETAWANGPTFNEKNWAMYFEYTIQ
jgi:hypothetical protein